MAPRITDPFFKQLYVRLTEEINNRVSAMASGGSSVRGNEGLLIDPINTAIKYHNDLAVINAYRDVIELGLQIDREIFGTKHIDDNGDD